MAYTHAQITMNAAIYQETQTRNRLLGDGTATPRATPRLEWTIPYVLQTRRRKPETDVWVGVLHWPLLLARCCAVYFPVPVTDSAAPVRLPYQINQLMMSMAVRWRELLATRYTRFKSKLYQKLLTGVRVYAAAGYPYTCGLHDGGVERRLHVHVRRSRMEVWTDGYTYTCGLHEWRCGQTVALSRRQLINRNKHEITESTGAGP